MRTVTMPVPVFGFVVATRAALAAGVALLVAGRLPPQKRQAVGRGLLAFGAATTIPAMWMVFRNNRRSRLGSSIASDPQLIGATRHARKGDDWF